MCIIKIITMRSCKWMNISEILFEYFAYPLILIFTKTCIFEKNPILKTNLVWFISSLEYSKSD